MHQPSVHEHLLRRGMTRRRFLGLCSAMAAWMALPDVPPVARPSEARQALAGTRIRRSVARALQTRPRLPVVWMAFQDCAGCTESLLRSSDPLVSSLLLDVLAIEYHETLSAAAGHALEIHRQDVMERFAGQYLLVVEGSVPVGAGGSCCAVGGRGAHELLEEAAAGAAAVLAVGNCAAFGGLPAAAPNPTGALAVRAAWPVPDTPLATVPGCPAIPEVAAGVLAHYFTFGHFGELDLLGRPLAHYGATVHEGCPRRPHFREGEFAASFDDPAARAGWCLYQRGCRGPTTYNACATRKWGAGLSFPVESGHPCLGCSEPGFWDDGDTYPWQPRAYPAFLPYAGRGSRPT